MFYISIQTHPHLSVISLNKQHSLYSLYSLSFSRNHTNIFFLLFYPERGSVDIYIYLKLNNIFLQHVLHKFFLCVFFLDKRTIKDHKIIRVLI